MYLPLSRSLLAQQATADSHAHGSSNSSSNSSSTNSSSSSSSSNSDSDRKGGKQEQDMREGWHAIPNSRLSADCGNGDIDGMAAAAGAAARCLWQQTVVDVRKGEELVVGPIFSLQKCDWAGFQQSIV
jgi:hypothetical protein